MFKFELKEDLRGFLAMNESKHEPKQFFKVIDNCQDDAFQTREFWMANDDGSLSEMRVVFGVHFRKRSEERMSGYYSYESRIKAVMDLLNSSRDLGSWLTEDPWVYEEGHAIPTGAAESIAVIVEGCDFVPIIVPGFAFLYVVTVLEKVYDKKTKRMGVSPNSRTRVLYVDRDGNVSLKRDAK